MGNNKKKSKAASNGHRPRNGKAHVGTVASAVRRNEARSVQKNGQPSNSNGSANRNLRTYEIPDYRLERPTFTITQQTEIPPPTESSCASSSATPADAELAADSGNAARAIRALYMTFSRLR